MSGQGNPPAGLNGNGLDPSFNPSMMGHPMYAQHQQQQGNPYHPSLYANPLLQQANMNFRPSQMMMMNRVPTGMDNLQMPSLSSQDANYEDLKRKSTTELEQETLKQSRRTSSFSNHAMSPHMSSKEEPSMDTSIQQQQQFIQAMQQPMNAVGMKPTLSYPQSSFQAYSAVRPQTGATPLAMVQAQRRRDLERLISAGKLNMANPQHQLFARQYMLHGSQSVQLQQQQMQQQQIQQQQLQQQQIQQHQLQQLQQQQLQQQQLQQQQLQQQQIHQFQQQQLQQLQQQQLQQLQSAQWQQQNQGIHPQETSGSFAASPGIHPVSLTSEGSQSGRPINSLSRASFSSTASKQEESDKTPATPPLRPTISDPADRPWYEQYTSYMRSIKFAAKQPVVAGKPLDLKVMYYAVQDMGGFERVNIERRWRTVGEKLGLPSNANITGSLKKNYEKFLFPFELHMKGQTPGASAPTTTTPAMSPPPSATLSTMDASMMQQQQQAANRLLAQQQQVALQMAKQANPSTTLVMNSMMHPGFMASPGMNLPTNMMQSNVMNMAGMSNQPMNMVNQPMGMSGQMSNQPMNMPMNMATSQGINMMNQTMNMAATNMNMMQPTATLPIHSQPIPTVPSSEATSSAKEESVPSAVLEEKEPDPKKPGYTPMKRIPGMVFNPNTRELEAETWAGFPVDMVEKVLGPLFDIVTTTVFPKEIIREFDPKTLELQLKSRIPGEVIHALNALSVLSADASFPFHLSSYPDLTRVLIEVLAECLDQELKDDNHQPDSTLFLTYQDLFEQGFDTMMNEEMSDDYLYMPTYHKHHLLTLYDITLCIENIFRNFTFAYENQYTLATNSGFIECLTKMFSLGFVATRKEEKEPSISAVRASRLLDHRKNALVVLSNMGAFIKIPTVKSALDMLTTLLDFIETTHSIYAGPALEAIMKLSVLFENRQLLSDASLTNVLTTITHVSMSYLPSLGLAPEHLVSSTSDDLALWEMAVMCIYNIFTLENDSLKQAISSIPGLFSLLMLLAKTPISAIVPIPPPPPRGPENPRAMAARMAMASSGPSQFKFLVQRSIKIIYEACKCKEGRLRMAPLQQQLVWMVYGTNPSEPIANQLVTLPPAYYDHTKMPSRGVSGHPTEPSPPRVDDEVARLASECLLLIQSD